MRAGLKVRRSVLTGACHWGIFFHGLPCYDCCLIFTNRCNCSEVIGPAIVGPKRFESRNPVDTLKTFQRGLCFNLSSINNEDAPIVTDTRFKAR